MTPQTEPTTRNPYQTTLYAEDLSQSHELTTSNSQTTLDDTIAKAITNQEYSTLAST